MSVVDELLSGSTEEERKRFPLSTSVVDELLSPANAPKISIRDETIIPKSTAAGGASAEDINAGAGANATQGGAGVNATAGAGGA